MTQKIVFDLNRVLDLMCHYSDGLIPPDAEVRIAGPHKYLTGWFGMVVRSRQWPPGSRMEDPIVYRYEGKHNMHIVGGNKEWTRTKGPHA